MAIIDNFTAFWELANVNDAHGSNTLTNNGTVTFVAGKVGNCANLVAASSQSLSIVDNAALSMGNIDFTIGAWLYLATKPGASFYALTKFTTATNQREYLLGWSQSLDRFFFQVSPDGTGTGLGTVTATNFGAPSTATFYFVLAEHDAANDLINISVNLVSETPTAHATGVFNGTAVFALGGLNGGTSNFWNGRIDQAFVKKGLFTADEKTWLYNGGTGRSYAEVLAGIPATSTSDRGRRSRR